MMTLTANQRWGVNLGVAVKGEKMKLSQKQAWLLLSRLFRKVNSRGCGIGLSDREQKIFWLNQINYGLCHVLSDLKYAGQISECLGENHDG